MKTAVIYYSFEGNSALVAEVIKAALNADSFEIKTTDTRKRNGFVKILWGCAQVFMNKKPDLLPLTVDINTYDLIIMGTPVWAGSPAPAIVSFLEKTKIDGKRIALYCCHAGGKGKVFEKFKGLLPGNTFAGEIDFHSAKNKESTELKRKIGDWLETINPHR